MSTEAGILDWRQDSPWRRLPWTLPGAILISAIIVWVLTSFMGRPTHRPPEPPPIDAQVIELPPPPPVVHRTQEMPHPLPKSVPKVKSEPVVSKPQTPAPVTKPAPTQPKPVEQAAPTQPAPPAPPSPPRHDASPSSAALSGNSGAQAIVRPMPQIPDELRDEALDAAAVARFHVAVDGSATVELAKPTPNPRINHLLLNTLRNWRFFPAMKDGKPVASIEEIVIHIQVN